jgi:hypothetical protein
VYYERVKDIKAYEEWKVNNTEEIVGIGLKMENVKSMSFCCMFKKI